MLECPRCNRENADDAHFCSACGAELAVRSAGAAEERKIVTVLFADVTGSTALGELLDPEALKELMRTFFDAMRAEIEAEGGTVEKFIGDAIMAAFGVPRVHEDDPSRALRAALRMRTRLRELNVSLRERHGVTLELRIGVNTGEVLAALDPRPGEALATGDAVNAAARLEQSAQPGQVLVAERTAQAARGFRFGEPQALELRGKSEPLRALELQAEQPVTEGTLSTRVPLVGRRRELDLLLTTYRGVVEERRPHLVTIYGDAGVGKSRLVGELLATLEASSPTPIVVRGRCLAYGGGITFWALAELAKTWAHVLDTDAGGAARVRIVAAVRDALEAAGVADAEELAQTLATSIGLEGADRPQRSPHELRAETAAAWRSFFSALAAEAPTIVLVEDLHWADVALLELLEDAADRSVGPVLFLCTARPELTERRPTWGGGRRSFTGLVVEPLSAAESERLAELLLTSQVDEGERAAILERAEGNPFFLEEIVRARRESAAAAARIPDTVQGALAARIDLLPAEEKTVLQAAAVVGRVFWPAAVAEVTSGSSAPVDLLLDGLQDRDLVLGRLSSSIGGQRELIFKHALIRDVAYESLPRRDRVRIHGAVADWIEQTFAERRGEIVELVGHHRAAVHRLAPTAESRAAAFAAVASAAEGALRRSALERAASLAREALELAATPLERARALEALGYVAFPLFDGTTAWESLREAADIVAAETPDDHARLAQLCGFAVMIPARAQGLMRARRPVEEVHPYLELGLRCVGDEDSEALFWLSVAQGYWEFGFGVTLDDEVDAGRLAAERAREIARRLDRLDLEAVALDALSADLNVRGHYGLADEIDEDRLAIARRIHDPFEVSDTFYTSAWSALEVGRYSRVLELGAEVEARELEVPTIGNLGLSALARLALGQWDEALADQARVRQFVGEESGPPPSFATAGYGVEALIRQARGEPAARAQLDELVTWSATDSPLRWPLAQAAVALAREGDFATAHQLLVRLADRSVFLPRELEARCAILVEEGRWDGAEALITATREHARTAKLLALPFHADRLEGRLRLHEGDLEGAQAALARAADGFSSLGAEWEVAVTRLPLGEALLALGRDDEAAAVLAAAAATFERLGVQRELARARELAS